MKRFTTALLLSLAFPLASASAQTIVFRSGNGSVGDPDSRITFLAGASESELRSSAFVAQDFSDAENGPAATIVTEYAGWLPSITDSKARWVAVDTNRTPKSALYAIKFHVDNVCWEAASLQFSFATDDQLGDLSGGSNELGLFLNEQPLAGSNGGSFNTETTLGVYDVTGLLQPGENTLYFYNRDKARVVSGVIFSGRVQITPMAPVYLTDQLTSNRFNGLPNNTLQLTATYDGVSGGQLLEIEFRHVPSGQKTWVVMPALFDRSTRINTFEFDICDWVPTCRCRISGVVPNGGLDGIAFGMFWKDKDGNYDLLKSRANAPASFAAFEGAWPISYSSATFDFLTPQLAVCPNGGCRDQARAMLYGSEVMGNGVHLICCARGGNLPKESDPRLK